MYVFWPLYKLYAIPWSEPLYAPGKLTVAGVLLALPAITLIWAHSLHNVSLPLELSKVAEVLHVELRAGVAASSVQSDQLSAQQVLAWCDASGDRNGLFALVGNEAVDTPLGAIKGIFGDLLQQRISLLPQIVTHGSRIVGELP